MSPRRRIKIHPKIDQEHASLIFKQAYQEQARRLLAAQYEVRENYKKLMKDGLEQRFKAGVADEMQGVGPVVTEALKKVSKYFDNVESTDESRIELTKAVKTPKTLRKARKQVLTTIANKAKLTTKDVRRARASIQFAGINVQPNRLGKVVIDGRSYPSPPATRLPRTPGGPLTADRKRIVTERFSGKLRASAVKTKGTMYGEGPKENRPETFKDALNSLNVSLKRTEKLLVKLAKRTPRESRKTLKALKKGLKPLEMEMKNYNLLKDSLK